MKIKSILGFLALLSVSPIMANANTDQEEQQATSSAASQDSQTKVTCQPYPRCKIQQQLQFAVALVTAQETSEESKKTTSEETEK